MNAPLNHSLEDFVARPKPRFASNVLLWAILAFFAIFVIWAALTELDRTVRGQGRVIPSARLQIVANLEGGIVAEIIAKGGDVVASGAPLIRLDRTQSGADLGSGEASITALAFKIARLTGEVQGRAPAYPGASGPEAATLLAIERSLHASRLADLSSLEAASQARVIQAGRAVAEADAVAEARRSAREAARSERDLVKPLVDRGIEPRLSLVQLENQVAVTAAEASAAEEARARTRAGVAEARASLAQARQTWRAAAATELAAAQAEFAARRSALPALADRADRTVVRAPLAGRINRVLVNTVGGAVSPGAPLVEIVPSEDSLLIEARIDPKDIASVAMGQSARINVSAYDSAVFGALDGEVVGITADSVPDEKTGDTFFLVRVRSKGPGLKGKDGRPLPITPGMTAEVNLLGEKRSILGYIFSPLIRLGDSALRE